MKIGVVGLGYVGMVTALSFSSLGHDVVGVDVDQARVQALRNGKSPVYEPGAEDYLARTRAVFTSHYSELNGCELVFIAVGTPPLSDGSQNLAFLRSAVDSLRQSGYRGAVVPRSTVLPGTTKRVVAPYFEHVGYNPEFLAEGSAFRDFFNPDKIVLGYEDEHTLSLLREAYEKIQAPRLEMDLSTAELVKYANNAFLSLKVAYANEIGNISKNIGVDVYRVMDAVGLDRRIGREFLNAGIGFGGSCFPKDLSALIAFSREVGYEPVLLRAIYEQNAGQPYRLVSLLKTRYPTLQGLKVGVLGLAFKPNTDDVREGPSIKIVSKLLEEGAEVHAYDPRATENFRKVNPELSTRVRYHSSARECVQSSDAVLILTEWQEFSDSSLYDGKPVFEGRRIFGREGVGW
jgi:UDPglucose 6-dehydrogenase